MPENFTSADFHNVVHKHLLNIVFDTLAKSKLSWEEVSPLLEAARNVSRADFEETARIRVHAVQAEGDRLVEAEEAYLGLSVADRDTNEEWLAETWWLSDMVIADNDRARARQAIAAIERSLEKIRRWVENEEGPDGIPSDADEAS